MDPKTKQQPTPVNANIPPVPKLPCHIIKLPALPMAEIYSFLTFRELFNVMISNSFFYASAKPYFATLYHTFKWDFLGLKKNTKPHRNFLEVMNTKFVKIPPSIPFDPLDTSILTPDLKYPARSFQGKGILYVKYSYDFTAAPGSFTPSAFALTCGGNIFLFKPGKIIPPYEPKWQIVDTVYEPRFTQIECSKSMCGLAKDGKVYDILPMGTGFSKPLEVTGIDTEVKQIGCTVKFHYAISKENIVYTWTPDDYVIRKVDCPKKEVSQISCEANFVFILYADSDVYVIDENETTENEDKALKSQPKKSTHSPELSKLHLTKIASGIVHSIAISQDILPPMKEWTSEQLASWLESIGFEDYVNVVKYKKITGKDIEESDQKYLEDTMGLVDENLMQKFTKEKSLYKESKVTKTVIYGWGTNHHGELASKANSCKYNNPLIIPGPELKNDNIKTIYCGFKTSAFITEKGSLYACGNVQALKKPESSKPPPKKDKKKKDKKDKKSPRQDSDEEKKKEEKKKEEKQEENELEEEKGKEKKHKKHKETLHAQKDELEEYQQKLDIDKNLKHRWVCLDRMLDPARMVDVKSITMSAKEIIISYSITKYTKDGKRIGKKFKGADKILKQIAWDERLKESKFIVGYEDRFLGLMELGYDDFVVSDVPIHRIQYIKKDGVLVWDRSTRLNKLA